MADVRLMTWGHYTCNDDNQWRSVPTWCLYYILHRGTQKRWVMHYITLHCALHFNHSAVVLLVLCDDFNSEPAQTVLISGSCNLLNYLFCFLMEWLRWTVQHVDWSDCRVHSHALCLRTHSVTLSTFVSVLFVFLTYLLHWNGLNYSIFCHFLFENKIKRLYLKTEMLWTKDTTKARHSTNNLLPVSVSHQFH